MYLKDQINWFLQESAKIQPIERPFTPDTGKDFGSIWTRQSDQITPTTRKLAKPNAMMFFHIPLWVHTAPFTASKLTFSPRQESYGTADRDTRTGKLLDIGLHGLEGPGSAKKSDGMFEKGLKQALESGHVADGGIPEVKVVANGHCHSKLGVAYSGNLRSHVAPQSRRTANVSRIYGCALEVEGK